MNWIKGDFKGEKKLFTQLGNKVTSPWEIETPTRINSSLTSKVSVKTAHVLTVNRKPKRCFVGQALQSEGFYLSKETYQSFLKKNKVNEEVIFPFLTGKEFLNSKGAKRTPNRFAIDFGQMSVLSAKKYKEPFQHIKNTVLPDIEQKAKNEIKKHGQAKDWNNHLKYWWRHWRNRPDLLKAIQEIKRYIIISRVTKRPIFEFISNNIHPGDALVAFSFSDNYSFGILQSIFHTEWLKARCSTLASGYRYTGDTVFSSFLWPQNPNINQVKNISSAVQNLIQLRKDTMTKNNWGLRELYNTLEDTGQNPLKTAHKELDLAVQQAYGMKNNEDILEFLLNLNQELYNKEQKSQKVTAPGLPPSVKNPKEFISKYCIKAY